jgi:hypothetical protein
MKGRSAGVVAEAEEVAWIPAVAGGILGAAQTS